MTARVLLIDDEPLVLTSLSRRLGDRFNLATAGGGPEAVAAVAAAVEAGRDFAAVMCDMHMPGMNGLETLARIKALSPETVAIMLTGDSDRQTAISAINQGDIFRFYVKPFDSAELGEGIAAAVRQHELLRAERRLAENEERLRLALEAVGDAAWDWNTITGELICSEGWRRMLGLSGGEPTTVEAQWLSLILPDDAAAVADEIRRVLDGKGALLSCEHRLRRSDGGERWVLARGSVLRQGRDGCPERLIGTFTDITERRLMEETVRRQAEELRILAATDPLTGLWNRRSFLEKAEHEVQRARRYGRALSVVMVDIDFFKKVNDTHGHDGGDAVLRRFSQVLKSGVRQSDVVGRWGGEEFVLLLPETDIAAAGAVADTLRRQVAAAPADLPDGATLAITASFGVSTLSGEGDEVTDMLRRADEALYEAKHSGRDRVACRVA